MPFIFTDHPELPDVKIIEGKIINDDRGWFMESYVERDFFVNNLKINICQENHSKSSTNVFRGLHYQLWPYDQGKLVRVVKGSLVDYFMDLRVSSKTFGIIGNYKLDSPNILLWIPRGFAHGIHILEDNTEIVYKVDNRYSPFSEAGIDPRTVLDLPNDIILSNKDKNWPGFIDAKYFP